MHHHTLEMGCEVGLRQVCSQDRDQAGHEKMLSKLRALQAPVRPCASHQCCMKGRGLRLDSALKNTVRRLDMYLGT